VGVTGVEVLTTLADVDFFVAEDVAFFAVTGLALTGVAFFTVTARRGRVVALTGETASTALDEDVDVMNTSFLNRIYSLYRFKKQSQFTVSFQSVFCQASTSSLSKWADCGQSCDHWFPSTIRTIFRLLSSSICASEMSGSRRA